MPFSEKPELVEELHSYEAFAPKFRRIAREVAVADGIAEREQTKEAAAALRTVSRILNSLAPTK